MTLAKGKSDPTRQRARDQHERYMQEAINEARESGSEGGIPIGSVLVRDGEIIARGHNRRVQDDDPTAHAEIDCLRRAGRIGAYSGTILYSTLMPCYLCAGAIVQFRIKTVVAGESATFAGARKFMVSHDTMVVDLDLDECKKIMVDFMKKFPRIWNEDIGDS